MAFRTVTDIHAEHNINTRGGSKPRHESGVMLYTNINSHGFRKASTQPKYTIAIRLCADVVQEARLQYGDRVTMDSDPESGLIRLRRVPDSSDERSWKLAYPGSKNKKGALLFRCAWAPGMPTVRSHTKCDHVVGGDGITIEIPKCAQWETCAREEEAAARFENNENNEMEYS